MTSNRDKLKLILVESALELVPKEIWGHPAVLKNAKKRGKKPGETLLDVSLHYAAMKNLRDKEKRGRPDIVQISLLNALESPLNKEGFLEVYVHTYEGHIIFIDPSVRLPRNYNRFVGLMEQLFIVGRVPPRSGKPLLYLKTMKLEELLESIDARGLILLDEKGELEKPINIVREAVENKYAIGIGGFPHGDYSKEVEELASKKYSIYRETLASWITVSRMIEAGEHLYGIL